jgi:glycosyltransferase involved in cell wall biosynthesis
MTQSTKVSLIQEELDYRAAIADCFLDLSEASIRNHAYDDALKYVDLAVHVFNSLSGDLSSPRVETNLLAIAKSLLTDETKENARVEPVGSLRKPVCLHVLNEAVAFGGQTAMATRWIQLDGDARIHSVVLLSQESPPPAELVRVVSESGGTIYNADQKSSQLQRAAWLRGLARNLAAYVVLHIDTTDLIAAVAFGAEGGPPVLLVNHAAHTFWVGASTPDIVVNCRGSRLEEHWTRVHRGVKNCATIPIPLPEPGTSPPTQIPRDELMARAREIIGIPKEAVVILTVGASYKYKPFGKIDFLKTCQNILEAVPEAFLLAAGVIEDDRWRSVSNKLGSRARALGSLSQKEIAILHQASDVYVEGFPFGSTTALLEAGLEGLPVVLAPTECPPPYGSDGVALDDTLERPASLEQYELEVVRLCRNPVERLSAGIKLRESILRHHTAAGWKRYLASALEALPQEHRINTPQAPPGPLPRSMSIGVSSSDHGGRAEASWKTSYYAPILSDCGRRSRRR